jgi:hypothetical protein
MHHRLPWSRNVRASHDAQLANLLKSCGIDRNILLAEFRQHGHDQTNL